MPQDPSGIYKQNIFPGKQRANLKRVRFFVCFPLWAEGAQKSQNIIKMCIYPQKYLHYVDNIGIIVENFRIQLHKKYDEKIREIAKTDKK